jgi:hypothetical protein
VIDELVVRRRETVREGYGERRKQKDSLHVDHSG